MSCPDTLTPTPAVWLDAYDAADLFQNANGTGPVTTLGDPVKKWVARVGGVHAGLNVAEFAAYDPTGINGHPAVRLGAGKSLLTASFLAAGYANAVSIYAAVKSNTTSSLQILAGDGSMFYLGSNAAPYGRNWFSGGPDGSGNVGGNTGSLNGACPWEGAAGAVAYVRGAGAVTLGAVGNLAGFPPAAGFLTSGGLVLGEFAGAFKFDGWLGEFLVFNATHDVATRAAMLAYLRTKWGLTDSTGLFVCCVGNSLTFGATGTIPYPVAMNASNTSWSVVNAGIGATTTPQLQARQTSMIAARPTGRGRTIAVLWEVGNHLDTGIGGGLTARQAVDAYWAWADAWAAGGWSVVVATVPHRDDSSGNLTSDPAAFNAAADAASVLILAEYRSHASAVADLAGDSLLNDPGNVTYRSDGIHYTDAGYARIAGFVQTAIRGVLTDPPTVIDALDFAFTVSDVIDFNEEED